MKGKEKKKNQDEMVGEREKTKPRLHTETIVNREDFFRSEELLADRKPVLWLTSKPHKMRVFLPNSLFPSY